MGERQADESPLVSVYRERITEPSTNDEVYGYWLFVVGIVASVKRNAPGADESE